MKSMEAAAKIPCEFILNPTLARYTDEKIRQFQGCPSVAVTKGGKIYAAWYSGGTREPHIDNFNLIVRSEDGGQTWSQPLVVIPSSRERLVHALDIQLFTAPDGRLFVYWVQNNVKPAAMAADVQLPPNYTSVVVDGYLFDDNVHAMWYAVCDDPDAQTPAFSAPVYADRGFLRCKPLVLADGRWLCFNYDQLSERYGYSISMDGGQTYEHRYGARKIPSPFDEAMAYEKRNGDIRMFARTVDTGNLAEAVSHDGGFTWDEAFESEIVSPSTRFFVARTPSGRILMVHNDHPVERRNMTVALSDDDGLAFPHRLCIDPRNDLSYPDCDFYDGKIVLIYDHGRTTEREILFASFTEEEIIAGKQPEITVVSKP